MMLLPSPVMGVGADSAPGGGSGAILFVTLPATFKDPHATTVPTTVSGARAAPATTTAAFGALQLNSVPSGASVYVDGVLQGTTPVLLRTLSTGSHTITLKLNGYQDYTKTVIIPGGGFLEETWTLAPAAPLKITTSPVYRQMPVTTTPTVTTNTIASGITVRDAVAADPAVLPKSEVILNENTSLQGQSHQAGEVLSRRIFQIGKFSYSPLLGSDSPYNPAYTMDKIGPITWTLIETDANDNNQRSYFYGDFRGVPFWTDSAILTIADTESIHMGNFRLYTAEEEPDFFIWQVSRYNFANDVVHWQNKYIPGLVASGNVKPYQTDKDGFQYFRIDFARAAKQNAGDPPYFDGIATMELTGGPGGQVKPVQASRIPFTSSAVTFKDMSLGFINTSVPSGIMTILEGEHTESEMLNLNEGTKLTCVACDKLRSPTPLESMISGGDQKYYVRVVPILKSGKVGFPSIPVKVTVTRPKACPTITSDFMVKPPSARIIWYMKPMITKTPDPYITHWVSVAVPSNQQFMPPDYHHVIQLEQSPKDSGWLQSVINFFKSIWGYFSWYVSQNAQLWNMMKQTVVKLASVILSYSVTAGEMKCSEIKGCETVLATALECAMAACGIPPTIPTADMLAKEGASYLAQLAADELGVGAEYTLIVDVYKDYVPDDVKKEIQGKAEEAGEQLVESKGQQEIMDSRAGKGRCFMNPQFTCNDKIPDPIFNSVHPASVLVYVENPNNQYTDRLFLNVTDSKGLFYPSLVPLPPLKPGDAMSVPVVLYENYDPYRKQNGGPCEWNKTAWENNEVETSCPESYWNTKLKQAGEDTLIVTFTKNNGTGTNLTAISNLDAGSSGKQIQVGGFIPIGCVSKGIKGSIRYPDGWQISTTGMTIDPNSWDNLFWRMDKDNNIVYSTDTGYLREK
ncbi:MULTISPECIES: PEGA domain-containing protein [unclassified Methanoregula]|uniref:PEGA domain-containing protein n=1 Tax=unclassified Methanoregula TaxID=2649730 RepID=UPI0025FA5192|nr:MULTISPECIES: PEGA domain-containing protein [unclassified Methanoregula]